MINLDPALLGKLLYWICLPLVLGLLTAFLLLIRQEQKSKRIGKFEFLLPAFALLLTGHVVKINPPQQRVLWDEAVVYSTSLSMHFSHNAYMPTMMVPTPKGNFPIQFALDKRPPLFSFLGSLAHALLEPSKANLFYVNILTLFLFFCFTSLLVLGRTGSRIRGATAPRLLSDISMGGHFRWN